MLLGALTMAGVAFLAPALDGAFVGTFVGADATALVVRADDGGEGTFLLDPGSDMPPGFVPGTRIVVRFEALGDGRFRATSVSPPRIPLEADVLTTLPTHSEGLSEPVAPITPIAVTRGTSSPVGAPERTSSATSRQPPPSAVQQVKAPTAPLAAAPGPSPRTVPAVSVLPSRMPATREAPGPRLAADWPLLLAVLMGAVALLGWGLLRYR